MFGWGPGRWEGAQGHPWGAGQKCEGKQQLHTFPREQRAELQVSVPVSKAVLLTINPLTSLHTLAGSDRAGCSNGLCTFLRVEMLCSL